MSLAQRLLDESPCLVEGKPLGGELERTGTKVLGQGGAETGNVVRRGPGLGGTLLLGYICLFLFLDVVDRAQASW